MDRAIALFLDMMSAERGASRHTRAAYGRDLENLAGLRKAVLPSVDTADLCPGLYRLIDPDSSRWSSYRGF